MRWRPLVKPPMTRPVAVAVVYGITAMVPQPIHLLATYRRNLARVGATCSRYGPEQLRRHPGFFAGPSCLIEQPSNMIAS
jgi:hypothetical protein